MPFSPRSGAVWALALALSAPACGAPEEDEAAVGARLPPRPGGARQGRSDAARAAVDALVAAPSPTTLLAVLGQGHGAARELLGRHTLRYTADFKLAPETAHKPVVDQAIAPTQEVRDETELRWAAGPGEPARFYLSQKTDKNRGREVIVVDEQVYTRLMHRGWHARPLDGDVHLRWLDEVQRSVHDVVAFAAPALAVTATEEGDVVRVELARGAAVDPALVAGGPGQAWRQRAEVTAIEGTLTLQRATGLWQSAEVHVRYAATDEQGRRLLGETHLTGEVEAAADLQVTPPDSPQPLPERVRYESERRRLLGGLAGT